jgi:hypothetical protein
MIRNRFSPFALKMNYGASYALSFRESQLTFKLIKPYTS